MPNLGEEIYSVLGVEPPDPSIWTMKQLMPRLNDEQKKKLLADADKMASGERTVRERKSLDKERYANLLNRLKSHRQEILLRAGDDLNEEDLQDILEVLEEQAWPALFLDTRSLVLRSKHCDLGRAARRDGANRL